MRALTYQEADLLHSATASAIFHELGPNEIALQSVWRRWFDIESDVVGVTVRVMRVADVRCLMITQEWTCDFTEYPPHVADQGELLVGCEDAMLRDLAIFQLGVVHPFFAEHKLV